VFQAASQNRFRRRNVAARECALTKAGEQTGKRARRTKEQEPMENYPSGVTRRSQCVDKILQLMSAQLICNAATASANDRPPSRVAASPAIG
jgi:hypothetical protein